MPKQYPTEVRQPAVRLVLEHRDEYGTEYAASTWPAACTGRAAGSVKMTAGWSTPAGELSA